MSKESTTFSISELASELDITTRAIRFMKSRACSTLRGVDKSASTAPKTG